MLCASLRKHMHALSSKILFNFGPATLPNGFLQQTYSRYSREILKLRGYNQTLKHISKTIPLYKVFYFSGKHGQQVFQCVFPQVLCLCNRLLESKSRMEDTSRGHLIQPFAQNLRFLRYMSPSTSVLQPLWTTSSSS